MQGYVAAAIEHIKRGVALLEIYGDHNQQAELWARHLNEDLKTLMLLSEHESYDQP